MDDAVRAREATREALADIEPEDLRTTLDAHVADASMTPAALTTVCARALDPDVDGPGLFERAAGVQLIYEGLRLTRRLVHDDPWTAAGDDGTPATDIHADLEILAADVLVSRGFYLLARTDAATRAVEVVRAFGRDQTTRDEADGGATDRRLEGDVFALAATAGTTAVGEQPRPALVEYASGLGSRLGTDLPGAAIALDADERDRLIAVATGAGEADASRGDDDPSPGRPATRGS